MHRTSATRDLRDLVDTLTPKVEAAVHTVAEKAPPALEHGRDVATARGAQLAGALAERLPDGFVDRLPDTVSDRLPVKRSHRGRKFLLLGGVAAVGVAVAYARRGRSGSTSPTTPQRTSYPRPVDETDGPVSAQGAPPAPTEAAGPFDPADPLAEARINGTKE